MRFTILLLLSSLLFSACSQQKKADTAKATTAQGEAAKGKLLFAPCGACHGVSGEGNRKLGAPALANIDPWYLYRQLMNYKKGIRTGSANDSLGNQMAAVAAALEDSIAVSHIVAYVSTFSPVVPEVTISGDVKRGEQYYQTICGSCHGPRGIGNEKMNAPKLSGIDDWYIERQILQFKMNLRGSHPADILGAQMVAMAALLPDERSIRDVVAYIQSYPKATK